VVGFKRGGIDAIAVDLPRGGAEKAVPVFIKTSGRGHEVVGGGQSFGGRVASMAAVEADFGGLVLFSYPLHRPGFPDQLRTEHFRSIKCPTLFMSGDRDPFARIELLKEKIKLIPNARLAIFKGQGHGLLNVLDDALDVAGLFKAFGRDTAHVAGHDWGAIVAWFFAARHPDMIRSLTALSVGHPAALAAASREDADQQERSRYIQLFLMEGKAERVLAEDDYRRLRAMFVDAVPKPVVD